MYVSFSHKTLQKKISQRKRKCEFSETENHACTCLNCALLTIENLTRSTSRTLLVMPEWISFRCVHKIYAKKSDCVPAVRRPQLVTETGLIVRQYLRTPGSVPGFALTTAHVLKFLFTGRDAAITTNSAKKQKSRSNWFFSRSFWCMQYCSTIGYHSNS